MAKEENKPVEIKPEPVKIEPQNPKPRDITIRPEVSIDTTKSGNDNLKQS